MHYSGNIFGNKCCRCNEGSLYKQTINSIKVMSSRSIYLLTSKKRPGVFADCIVDLVLPPPFLGMLSTNACAHTFTSNSQLPFLNQWRKKTGRRNHFMTNLLESCVAELGFERAIPGSVVRRASNCAVEPGET